MCKGICVSVERTTEKNHDNRNNVHVKKWEFFVPQNVIQNEVVVKIWVNRVKYFDL